MNKLEEDILVFAARYAHTRNTYAALVVIEHAIDVWDKLSHHTKEQLIREARNEAIYHQPKWEYLATLDPIQLELDFGEESENN